jgi:sodium transport system permease protein
MSKIFVVLKKELRRFFTDPRMLTSIFLPGILIFIIYSLLGGVVTDMMSQQITDYSVHIENEPIEFSMIFDVSDWNVEKNKEVLTKEEAISKISEGSLDLYIIYEEDFYNKILAYDTTLGKAPDVEIYYNSTIDSSYALYNYVTTYLSQIEAQLANKFDVNNDLNINYDMATEEDISTKIIGMILPFILMTFLISGAMGICSESIAGEKERGTIATLLVTPVRRSDLVIGKIGALGITTMASAFVSFLGLILSLPKLAGADFSIDYYGVGPLAILLLVVVVTALFFTTILTIVSTYAKSVKEATSLSGPLTIIVMVVGMSGMMATSANTNLWMYLIPIYNSIQSFTGILNDSINIFAIIITVISNLAYIGLGVFLLTKMFNSEKIMFNK